MRLSQKINEDLKTAMKAKNQAAVRSIRAIKAAIILLKTDGTGKEIDDDSEIKLLQKLVKQRQDSLDIFKKQDREDLAKIEREEIEIISSYLPAQLSEEELTQMIQQTITDLGANSMKDMGKVMGILSKKVAGKADGRLLASIVKGILTTP